MRVSEGVQLLTAAAWTKKVRPMTQNGKTIFADELRFVLLDISRYITVDEIAQDVLHCFVTYLPYLTFGHL